MGASVESDPWEPVWSLLAAVLSRILYLCHIFLCQIFPRHAFPHLGDEIAVTHDGNNNWYGHDSKMTRMDWSPLKDEGSTQAAFYRFLSQVRKQMTYRRRL